MALFNMTPVVLSREFVRGYLFLPAGVVEIITGNILYIDDGKSTTIKKA